MQSRIEDWVQSLLRDTGALLEGHFQLSAGRHSAGYVQCALLLQHPRLARQVGESLAEKLSHLSPESVLAPALGGLLIGHEVAAALDVPFRFTERVGEGMALRRGFDLDSGERVVVVEDVVTTGRSCLEAMSVAQERGARDNRSRLDSRSDWRRQSVRVAVRVAVGPECGYLSSRDLSAVCGGRSGRQAGKQACAVDGLEAGEFLTPQVAIATIAAGQQVPFS